MAMIYCRECGKQISDSAKHCPHCGYEFSENNRNNSNTLNPTNLFGAASNFVNTNDVQTPIADKNQRKFVLGIDTIIHTLCSILFVIFMFTETFFSYILVTTNNYDDFNHYRPNGNLPDLLLYGIDGDYGYIIVLIISLVVLMLVFSWIKCISEKTRRSSAFGIINLILSILLGVSFVGVVLIARDNFYTISYTVGAGVDFSKFLAGYYIELGLLIVFFVLAIVSIIKAGANKSKMKKQIVCQQAIYQPTQGQQPVYQTATDQSSVDNGAFTTEKESVPTEEQGTDIQ